ncbi:MAG: insulinase family protein [Phycisphaerales bacterium]|nr:insulinase family protein [Phycisphaerales bacterium]
MPVQFKSTTLDNGLTILAEIDPKAQSVGAGFFVKTGARDEETSLMGVSHYLEHMMFKGTEEITAEQLNQTFDDLGASNNAYTTRESTCFYAHVIPDSSPKAIEMLSKMMRPALRQDDFDTEKNVIQEEIAMYADNPFWVLYEQCVANHYNTHGLGHRVLGTSESVGAMQRDQMMDYFQNRYSADNTIVALAGNLDFDTTVDQIRSLCGDWNTSKPSRNTSRPKTGHEAFTMSSDRVNRGYILGLSDAPPQGSDDRYAATLMTQILGGADNSRLHWALIETGIAEEAMSAYDGLDGTGDYFLYASGDPESLDHIWEVMLKEIRGLKDSITEDDLAKLRAKMLTSVTLAGEKPAGRMQRLGRLWLACGKYQTLEEEIEKINAVSVKAIKDLIDQYPLDQCTLGKMIPAPSK